MVVLAVMAGCSPGATVPEDEALYIEAKTLYENREFDAAIELFKKICDEYIWSDKADNSQYFIGASWLGKATDIYGDLAAPVYLPYAKESFLKVGSESTRFVDALYGIGQMHYLAEEYDSSNVYCYSVFKKYPGGDKADNAALLLGNSYRKTGEYDSSIIWYEIIVKDYKGETAYDNGLYWAADYYYDRKNIEENLIKAAGYYEEYVSIADTLDEKFKKAVIRLEYLEGLL